METHGKPHLGSQKRKTAPSQDGDNKSERDQASAADAERAAGKRKRDASVQGGVVSAEQEVQEGEKREKGASLGSRGATEGRAQAVQDTPAGDAKAGDDAEGQAGMDSTAHEDVTAAEGERQLPDAVIEEGRLYMLYM